MPNSNLPNYYHIAYTIYCRFAIFKFAKFKYSKFEFAKFEFAKFEFPQFEFAKFEFAKFGFAKYEFEFAKFEFPQFEFAKFDFPKFTGIRCISFPTAHQIKRGPRKGPSCISHLIAQQWSRGFRRIKKSKRGTEDQVMMKSPNKVNKSTNPS